MEVLPLIFQLREVKKTEGKFREGEYEVRIRLSQLKEKIFIPLGYSSSVEDWDESNNLPRPSHPHYKELSLKINKYLDDIRFELKMAERSGQFLYCLDVKRKVTNQEGSTVQRTRLKILEYFDKVITELEDAGNPGYADIFDSTRATVSKLLNNGRTIPPDQREKEKDKSFLSFTQDDHQKYEKLISAGTSESTISLYLRTYYRIWNLAIEDKYCSKEKHHPAQYIKFRAYKTIKTKKRAIKKDYLGEIMKLKFAQNTRMFRSHLLLQFMYYARGINFGDMCKLKKENIANGIISYTRAKNHRKYDYTLHPKALEIVEYFKSYPLQSDAGRIFPILFSIHNTARKIDQRIESALKDFNEDLKTMAQTVGWERKFTSYSLRHGFATHLRRSGVDIGYIKEALGHELEAQTAVYLDDTDDEPLADTINNALNFDDEKPKKVKRKGRQL